MIPAGVLLDTGPLVALLSAGDTMHARARSAFALCKPPLRCCEPVLAEACHLLSKLNRDAPADLLAMGRAGVFTMGFQLPKHWEAIESLLRQYRDRPVSLADACIIRMAEIHGEPRVLTFDSDFRVYRWSRRRAFELIGN